VSSSISGGISMKTNCSNGRVRSAAIIVLAMSMIPAGAFAQGEMGAGTEDRDWIEAPSENTLPAGNFEVELFPNTKVPMRDGVELDGRRYVSVVDEPRGRMRGAEG